MAGLRPEDSPRVTVALLAYNQERFVAEAVHSVLAQDFEPLEVILSDDCSVDRTFEVMTACAAGYSGPHRLIVRKNEANEGLGQHLNTVAAVASGEWLVVAAGDDISEPRRVTALASAWQASGGRARAVYSALNAVSEDGEPLRVEPSRAPEFTLSRVVGRTQGVCGATAAVHREVFDFFGPLDRELVYEDIVLCARALLLGGVAWVEAPLVRHRLTDAALSRHGYDKRGSARLAHHRTVVAREMYAQLNVMRDLLGLVARRQDLRSVAADGLFRVGFFTLLNALWWSVFPRPLLRTVLRLGGWSAARTLAFARAWKRELRLTREETQSESKSARRTGPGPGG